MNQILLPIKPKYSQAILRGEKTFELRRRIPKRKIEKVFIYETAPTMKIVGWFEVEKILTYNIKKLWKETKEKNLINWDEFQSYFSSLEFGNAYKIKKVKKYERAHTLKKYDIKFHPQNFIYINSKPATMK